jgi:hypothetical protein
VPTIYLARCLEWWARFALPTLRDRFREFEVSEFAGRVVVATTHLPVECFFSPRAASLVMAGLVPAIHVFRATLKQGVDARIIWREDALRAFARA